ncbi:hypothetical protein PJI17_14500 [Mycobacterium kansasii]
MQGDWRRLAWASPPPSVKSLSVRRQSLTAWTLPANAWIDA